ncbi:hypothetical protein AB0395_35175 [Streptosporangium sp. NPDC051023]|uniref:hypothetical protein n=1 Tax=Streptosporangium sp. NPDC051023 TaxID=3155410 RepID=UPI00344F6FF1
MSGSTQDRITAPWPSAVVGCLNAYQALGYAVLYRCQAPDHDEPLPALVATEEGWVCPDSQCAYTQNWACAEHGDGRATAAAEIFADLLGERMTPGAAATAEQVVTVLAGNRFFWADEYELHQSIAGLLVAGGFEVRQEVPLSTGGRIDLMTGRVGIEIKVNGRPSEVMRQITRYAASPDIDALVLATTRATHRIIARTIGTEGVVNDTPVTIVQINGMAL